MLISLTKIRIKTINYVKIQLDRAILSCDLLKNLKFLAKILIFLIGAG
jgi:hypothetical protein